MPPTIHTHCPILTKNQLPTQPCPFAMKTIQQLRLNALNAKIKFTLEDTTIHTDHACDYYIIDQPSHYCWFAFWNNPNNIREYTQEEITQLLGLSIAMVHFAEKDALDHLKHSLPQLIDKELLEDYALPTINTPQPITQYIHRYQPHYAHAFHNIQQPLNLQQLYSLLDALQHDLTATTADIITLVTQQSHQPPLQLSLAEYNPTPNRNIPQTQHKPL